MKPIGEIGEIHTKLVHNGREFGALSEGEAEGGVKHQSGSLVLVDARALDRECLARSIAAQMTEMRILAFDSIAAWKKSGSEDLPLEAILINVGDKRITDPAVSQLLRSSSEFAKAPVIVLADCDEISEVVQALDCGARGYIPSSLGIAVCVEAIRLAMAGGTFVPGSSMLAARHLLVPDAGAVRPTSMFTARQAEVVEALRRGKANKIIAYELNMCESTVKVHVRNVMKKVKATNRTEVAYKIHELLHGSTRASC